jgi:hypothetical protein
MPVIWTAKEGEFVIEMEATTLWTRIEVFWQLTGGIDHACKKKIIIIK